MAEHDLVGEQRDREGDQREVEVLEPQGGERDQRADSRGDGAGDHDPEQLAVGEELAHHERTDADEGELAQRDLAAVPRQQHEAEHHHAEDEPGGGVEQPDVVSRHEMTTATTAGTPRTAATTGPRSGTRGDGGADDPTDPEAGLGEEHQDHEQEDHREHGVDLEEDRVAAEQPSADVDAAAVADDVGLERAEDQGAADR